MRGKQKPVLIKLPQMQSCSFSPLHPIRSWQIIIPGKLKCIQSRRMYRNLGECTAHFIHMDAAAIRFEVGVRSNIWT